MATRLGDVWMQFRLDTRQAQQDIEALSRRVPRGQPGAAQGAPPSGMPSVDPVGKPRSETQKDTYLKQLSGAVLKKAGGGLQSSPVTGAAQGILGQASEFIPPSLRGAARTAGAAAAAYGIASETLKLLPEAFAYGKELAGITGGEGGQRIEIIERTLDELRMKVIRFEAAITSIIGAMKQTLEFTEAARRLTGKMPNTEYYYQQNQQVQQARTELQKKFDSWKSKEAPMNTAASTWDFFKRSFSH